MRAMWAADVPGWPDLWTWAPEQMWTGLGKRGVWETFWPFLGAFSVPRVQEGTVPCPCAPPSCKGKNSSSCLRSGLRNYRVRMFFTLNRRVP